MNSYERNERVAAAREALQVAGRRHAAADIRIMEALKRYLSAEEYHEFVEETRKSRGSGSSGGKAPAGS